MSVAEFSNLLKDQAYKTWFKASSTNVLNKSVTELREYEESSAKTDFIITEDTIKDVVKHLTNRDATEEQITNIIKKLKVTRPKKVIQISETKGATKDNVVLKFSRVNLTQIGSILNQAFEEEISTSGRKISDFFQRGHVVGVATNLVKQTQFGIKQSRLTADQKSLLLGLLEDYIKVLEKDDVATSNIKNPEHELYVKYTKNYRRYLVELQPKTLNQEAGRSVAPITASLRKYFKPENYVLLSQAKLAKDPNNFFSKLIETKGSPSMLDLISEAIKDTIKGKPISDKTYTVPSTKIYSKKINIQAASANSGIKKAIQEAKRVISIVKAQKVSPIRSVSGQFYSLASLQTLINSHLQSVISANMGSGSETNVLNYRTGRFAASAQVERMSQSRAGAITAFYQFQNNPYQTFEPGFRQGSPKTRDPKLLISKSIREIAATKAANTLRAVKI